jgi:hypothetical protein
MLYSKNGSIPKPETDGTEGWIEVPDAPECPAGKEVVWWYPPGWVIRDPQPGANWSWSQSEERWVEYVPVMSELTTESLPAITSADIPALSSSDIQVL